MTKYVFVTGGVLSGVGKGVTTASIAMLFQSMGYNTTIIKIDPYLNVDAGTMNPYAHGEVFVTEDGGETDLDIGHYERFLNKDLSKKNNITAGQIYYAVIMKERRGEYLGATVQIIPHVTNEIKQKIRDVGKEYNADMVFVEIGGTVGDIESLPFLEAARQMKLEEGFNNVAFIHVALVPTLKTTGEQKTKPVQHSVQELRRIGIQPDIIVARCEKPLNDEAKAKIALFSNVPPEAVISNHDVNNIYEVPIILMHQNIHKILAAKLSLNYVEPNISPWLSFLEKLSKATQSIRIAMIGKYTKLRDSYISIVEAIKHASAYEGVKPVFKWIESTDIENGYVDISKELEDVDGAIILPGFGKRGAEGKIKAVQLLRENNVPTLGLCFGFQLMVVEIARNVAGLANANSTELDPSTPYPVIDLLPSQREIDFLGGSMRLGAIKIKLFKNRKVYEAYGKEIISERHRHRYGVNIKYIDRIESTGFVISGVSLDNENVIEFMELRNNFLFIGTQAHPEFKSRPLTPSPIYHYFISKIASKIRK
ncbi:CTP synthase [Ignisphaera sp. 4213-co]|uniref:CTP synthase n=1 Tax=Ignisphaera cupida TaxID=3050454 RepID=A0ABD4Z5K3_9CREN|nr:CTP synthase [Ignisphaera sp. 4213-co]MDK6028287.1 CTP synthase [Ignisphaera sp. 4213-co]